MASSSTKSVSDFLHLARSWLKMVAALGVNFQKVWRPEQNFVLAQKVSPRSSPDRRTFF
jgi:hypothetical protein